MAAQEDIIMTIWAILPAAGIGRRMGSITPKQYLLVNGATVIAHSLRKLAAVTAIQKIVVVLHPDDTLWTTLTLDCSDRLQIATGGDERFQSVLNGLEALKDIAAADDWVLVHDAVRPCVRSADIQQLIATLQQHDVGGLLGMPLENTLKRVNEAAEVEATVERSHFWHAMTPQMFRYGLLTDALRDIVKDGVQVTDEAAAVERLGLRPQMVAGHSDNIKITHEADLLMAGRILETQEGL